MSDRVEQMFSNLRRGPWNADPTGVPQEGFGGNGNIESQGWLSDGSVTADVIQANAVIAGKIDADAVTAREIAANTITANEIAANTITAAQIAANTITASEIAANTITASEIAANAITASELAANSVVSGKIAANTITATEIAANAITASELAADSVITAKIAAGNVTSSRIELTLSGKNFQANSDASGLPAISFDSSTTSGMGVAFTGGIVVGRDFAGLASSLVINDVAFIMGGGTIDVSGTLQSFGDGAESLGSSSRRWADVWAVDGSINTSDARLKTDIIDSPLGLPFIKSLHPVAYRWRDTVDTQAHEAAAVDEDSLKRELAPLHEELRRVRAAQLSGEMTDTEAEALVVRLREQIAAVDEKYQGPVREARRKRRPGKRQHYGLIAQEVKAALDAAGLDAAFWKQSPDGRQHLAYTELIAPLIQAVQELAAEVDRLRDLVEKDKDAKG